MVWQIVKAVFCKSKQKMKCKITKERPVKEAEVGATHSQFEVKSFSGNKQSPQENF